MRFGGRGGSNNVEDRRGSGMGVAGGSIGVGTVVLALVAWYFGIDPSVILGGTSPVAGTSATQQGTPLQTDPGTDPLAHFVSRVLGDTEQTWHQLFAAQGQRYVEPRLVLFRGATPTACGTGQSAMGPFYCPLDQQVYIDLAFYDELQQRFQAPGDFAQAYVIAHEVGHHVQQLMGISEQVREMRARLPEVDANALSVRQELQADCFAGVWAHHASARNVLEAGDVEEALQAATAIGDDTLQRRSSGQVVPESFTHGSAAQRVRWFRRGLDSGSIAQCDSFEARQL